MFIKCMALKAAVPVLIESSAIVSISPAAADPSSDIPGGTLIRTWDNRSWQVSDTVESIVAALMACDKHHHVVQDVVVPMVSRKKR